MANKACRLCGELKTELKPIYGYDWDNPNEDEQGSIQVLLGYECCDKTACQERRQQIGRALRNQPDDTYIRGMGQGWGRQS